MLTAVGPQSVVVSCEEKRKNKGSAVVVSPKSVSVPNKKTCLSGIDTKLNCDLVGVVARATALVPVPADVSHLNVFPCVTVAKRSSPKVSNDHPLPSIVTVDVERGVFHVPVFHVLVPQP